MLAVLESSGGRQRGQADGKDELLTCSWMYALTTGGVNLLEFWLRLMLVSLLCYNNLGGLAGPLISTLSRCTIELSSPQIDRSARTTSTFACKYPSFNMHSSN